MRSLLLSQKYTNFQICRSNFCSSLPHLLRAVVILSKQKCQISFIEFTIRAMIIFGSNEGCTPSSYVCIVNFNTFITITWQPACVPGGTQLNNSAQTDLLTIMIDQIILKSLVRQWFFLWLSFTKCQLTLPSPPNCSHITPSCIVPHLGRKQLPLSSIYTFT